MYDIYLCYSEIFERDEISLSKGFFGVFKFNKIDKNFVNEKMSFYFCGYLCCVGC